MSKYEYVVLALILGGLLVLTVMIQQCDKKVSVDRQLPREASIVKVDDRATYIKISNRYYIRQYHGMHQGYTVYEVEKCVVTGECGVQK